MCWEWRGQEAGSSVCKLHGINICSLNKKHKNHTPVSEILFISCFQFKKNLYTNVNGTHKINMTALLENA